jgi:hypothetical protein
MQGPTCGSGGKCLDELNKGVLHCVSQFLSHSSATLAIRDTYVANFLRKRKQGHLYRQLVALIVNCGMVKVRVFCSQARVRRPRVYWWSRVWSMRGTGRGICRSSASLGRHRTAVTSVTGGDSIRGTMVDQGSFFADPDSTASQSERRRLRWGILLGSIVMRTDGGDPGACI